VFIGAINATVRQFLGNVAPVMDGRTVVVGCSGNFTSEAVVAAAAKPAGIHSNDVSLYSCMAGRWLTGAPLDFHVTDAEPGWGWLERHLTDPESRLAAIMVLLDMLPFERQNNAHKVRMWTQYRDNFPALVERTAEKLRAVRIPVDSFYAGDVSEHFDRFKDDENAVFMVYAPTYTGGYEKMYARLEEILRWTPPQYPMLTEERRDALLAWCRERRYLWYDDRVIPDFQPVMQQESGLQRTVYLYSNIVQRTAFFSGFTRAELPKLPLADHTLRILPTSDIRLIRFSTSDLRRYKDAFLAKNIKFASGHWAFAVAIDGKVVGFLEYQRGKFGPNEVYTMADFAVPHTPYTRLSKLIVMLMIAGETRKLLERCNEGRLRSLSTTAFTARPVSMKYRGILTLDKRGQTEDGKPFLNYSANFNDATWKETLAAWLTKHGSARA
jgi:hypothetical protein